MSESRAVDEIELVAVGDISLGDSAQGVGDGLHSRFERLRDASPRYPFERVDHLLRGAEIVFGNLETVLSHDGLHRSRVASMEMRGHPEAAARLAAAGFTVLSVANNHTMQHGEDAFSDTVARLENLGVGVAGVATPDHRSCVPWTETINGLRVTTLAYAFEEDKYAIGPVAYAYAPNCDIPGDVAAAKQTADLVICSVHWGVEFVTHPSEYEEKLGRRLIDAGADLVLGHHPHVPRRIDRYGRGLIVYSLGNFVFDMLWNPWLRMGVVLKVVLGREGVRRYATELVWIGDDYQPGPLPRDRIREAETAFAELHARPEWVSVAGQYDQRYRSLVVRNRHESHRHFLRRTLHRPVSYTAQTVLRTAGRKIASRLGLR